MKIFALGETTISPFSILKFTVIFVAFVWFSKYIARKLMVKILSRFQIESGLSYTLTRITEYILISVGAIVAFQNIGIDLSGLAVIFGLLSVGIGFGLQNISSNFISGLILLLERPVKVGDRVTVGDIEGDVEEINMRATTVRTINNISIIVPNSEFISNKVINWSHGDSKVRLDIEIGVSYNSNLKTVQDALLHVAQEADLVLNSPSPEVLLKNFGDSAWEMQLRVWIKDPKKHHHVRSNIRCAIVEEFRKKKIEIPFPQRDLYIRSIKGKLTE
ncbi:mechanosensitive ion channel family protein [candidate division KSB1 bacterium]|nr:mechanosensitive ion channel family protein [candidate division KSB1 bacterium]